jgi:hypothetical protein
MIPRIRNILYATDLSKNSAMPSRWAVNSAQKHDAGSHPHVLKARWPRKPPSHHAYLPQLDKIKKGSKR